MTTKHVNDPNRPYTGPQHAVTVCEIVEPWGEGSATLEVRVDPEDGQIWVIVHDVRGDLEVSSANALHARKIEHPHYEPAFARSVRTRARGGKVTVLYLSRQGSPIPNVCS
jgi:hypothetical protein